MTDTRYLQPGWFTRNVFNRSVRRLTLLGISVMGSRELRERGRTSGQWRATPVNPLTLGPQRYLISPRGTTEWVRNMRAAGAGELRVGRRVETFTAVEVSDEVKVPILREYLRMWGWEVGAFFPGISAKKSSDADIAGIAAGFPVFAIETGA